MLTSRTVISGRAVARSATSCVETRPNLDEPARVPFENKRITSFQFISLRDRIVVGITAQMWTRQGEVLEANNSFLES